MKTERVSYDCMTPSAARGLLESIYWHPGLMWRIDRIHVCRPIRFTNIRRNEVKDKISARNVKTVMERGAMLPPCPEELLGMRDLGWMLWDMDYGDPQDIRPRFFRAVMTDGIVTVPPPESGEVHG